jgi:hypothetical protein
MREFLDSSYARPDRRSVSVTQQPRSLRSPRDAYIASVAEHLARCHDSPIPTWAETLGLVPEHPIFASGLESLNARLKVESPGAFRRRMPFVSKDALFRPRAVSAEP